jgi:hypothetical protein
MGFTEQTDRSTTELLRDTQERARAREAERLDEEQRRHDVDRAALGVLFGRPAPPMRRIRP